MSLREPCAVKGKGPEKGREERERLENVAIANALQLEAARATPALSRLITTPCQV